MAVTPAGMLSVPPATLRTLLSTLTAVQTWMGVGSTALALAKIHICQFDEPTDAPGSSGWKTTGAAARPLIVVGVDLFTSEADDQAGYWGKDGEIYVDFQEIAQNETGVETAVNPVTSTDAILHHMNAVGAIMTAYEAAVAAGGTLHGNGWRVTEQAGRTKSDERDTSLDICGMTIAIPWRDSK